MDATKKSFNWCLNRDSPGLRRISPDYDRAKMHMETARRNLETMAYLHNGMYFDWVVTTGYYAMYHAALAALCIKGFEGKDHNCVVIAINHLYIGLKQQTKDMDKAKNMEKKFVEDLNKARIQRINVQYGISKIVSTDVDWIIPASRGFVNKIEEIIHTEKIKK